MVSYINQLRQEGMAIYDAVFRGALSRLRTVLMTAWLAMLGLLPMALSHGIGSETQRPLALVVIGGLFSATLLTLYVLPALYYFVATHPRLARALH
jgi:cobalt-zinc-cadmium resistance protein CzcA